MRFDSASSVEETVWDMRLTDLPRAEDRATLLRLYNGNPPFDKATEEENNIQVNMNDLSGPNVMMRARSQWNNAHLKGSRFFTARPDSGPGHKRTAWSQTFSNHANRLLKKERRMRGLIRAQGANTLTFGIGPSNWQNRRGIVPVPIPVGSLMIPSESEIDNFDEDLSYFAIFREWSPSMLWDMTHGPKTDFGWNMDLLEAQWDYIKDELRKSPNSVAFQYMPERIEELMKQDKGYMGTDAVPTCDVWDFYFREAENGKGWYRRVILDWNIGETNLVSYKHGGPRPESRNKVKGDPAFLYSSGSRKYANSFSEIIHCQFGDCSPYGPVKYHSMRGLGWLMWGVCELQNRLHCKFNEQVFQQLMWFFRTASNQDLVRLKMATFEHMGVIPQGIAFVPASERYVPDEGILNMAFARNRQLMADSSTAFTQGYDKGTEGEGRTATETMAIVNSSQSLASGVLEESYGYQKFLYSEMVRRLCLKRSTDPMAKNFRLSCLQDGIPEEMLDVEKWTIEPEQVIGGGNKTLQMAQVQFLNSIRKNLPPNGQRVIDHISVETATEQPDLAEEIVPLSENQPISDSMHDAQEATGRILRGLPFTLPKFAVFEDYVRVWIHDLAFLIQQALQKGSMVSPDDLAGIQNLGKHIGGCLQIMAKNQDEKPKVKELEDAFQKLMNHLKGFEQRLQAAQKKQAGANGAGGDPKDAAKAQAIVTMGQTKAKIAENSAASRTRQKEQQFQLSERRKDQQQSADIYRTGIETRHELLANRLKALSES